jgi:acetolactate synthase-1/2/3 large subunit
MPIMTTAETVIATLLAHGIDTLFALPGVHDEPLFDVAHKASDRSTRCTSRPPPMWLSAPRR